MTPDLDFTLGRILQYAIDHGMSGEDVEKVFSTGLGAASFLQPELLGRRASSADRKRDGAGASQT